MIEIFKDKHTEIHFDQMPKLEVLYVTPDMSKEEAKAIKEKPFLCKNTINILAIDKENDNQYQFTIQAGYRWNGANIPRAFWRLIGSQTEADFLMPSMVHDFECENHEVVGHNRNLSSRVFKGLLISCGVGKCKAQTMYLAVDNFQRFCGWKKNSVEKK